MYPTYFFLTLHTFRYKSAHIWISADHFLHPGRTERAWRANTQQEQPRETESPATPPSGGLSTSLQLQSPHQVGFDIRPTHARTTDFASRTMQHSQSMPVFLSAQPRVQKSVQSAELRVLQSSASRRALRTPMDLLMERKSISRS